MSLTLLFDLDDTLLDTNMDAFVPAYFQGLSKHVGDRVAPEIMLRALVHGMNLMNESEDPTRTLQEVFEADFYRTLGSPKSELWDAFEDFYDHVFPSIGMHTRQRPDALIPVPAVRSEAIFAQDGAPAPPDVSSWLEDPAARLSYVVVAVE